MSIGRLLAAQMTDKDTQGRVAERLAYRRAGLLAIEERAARYPVLTAENSEEAMAYQAERIKFHMEAGS